MINGGYTLMALHIIDAVHGMVKLDELQSQLLDTPEVQRLKEIRQLGLANLVFPGAHHTRLEHSLGTSHVSSMIGNELNLSNDEKKLVTSAGMLHDLGHIPYSHTFESVLFSRLGFDHMDLTESLIKGDGELVLEPAVPEILIKHGVEPNEVSDLIKGMKQTPSQATLNSPKDGGQSHFCKNRLLHQIVHSTLDADQLDFLLRDSYFTGVAHGVIDLQRIIRSMRVLN
ncbi:MAG TPA: HD domain-containing protein, partial [Euryarchaeota archaeon]|nr:HD domain-containing protein [Euryarchaeota archaeon]